MEEKSSQSIGIGVVYPTYYEVPLTLFASLNFCDSGVLLSQGPSSHHPPLNIGVWHQYSYGIIP
jgi:hypothetical protein